MFAINEYYKTDERLLTLLMEIEEAHEAHKLKLERVKTVKKFIIDHCNSRYQIFFCESIDDNLKEIYHKDGVVIYEQSGYEYIDVLGLTNDEIEYLGVTNGDEIQEMYEE